MDSPTSFEPATKAAGPRLGDRGCAALLAFCCLLGLLALQAVEPYFFLRDDNATHFLAAYTYAYESLAGAGELPLLNHHQFLGSTFLAAGQTGVFLAAMYPLAALARAAGADARVLIDLLAKNDKLLECLIAANLTQQVEPVCPFKVHIHQNRIRWIGF